MPKILPFRYSRHALCASHDSSEKLARAMVFGITLHRWGWFMSTTSSNPFDIKGLLAEQWNLRRRLNYFRVWLNWILPRKSVWRWWGQGQR